MNTPINPPAPTDAPDDAPVMKKASVEGKTKARGLSMPGKGYKLGVAIVLNAVEGFGKTTMGATAKSSAILMAPQERGYLTLQSRGLVPDRPVVTCESWLQTLDEVDELRRECGDIKVLVVDAIGGFERLCHEYVCAVEFGGDWGEKGFQAYQRGYGIAVSSWMEFLVRLDMLRTETGMHILMLGHIRRDTYKNPLGADYDRLVCDCHQKTWGVTHKWAEAVLMGHFEERIVTDKGASKKGKADPTYKQRIIETEHSLVWDAKNQYDMPEQIEIPNDRTAAWKALAQHIWRK
jgi:hypothetical protein